MDIADLVSAGWLNPNLTQHPAIAIGLFRLYTDIFTTYQKGSNSLWILCHRVDLHRSQIPPADLDFIKNLINEERIGVSLLPRFQALRVLRP